MSLRLQQLRALRAKVDAAIAAETAAQHATRADWAAHDAALEPAPRKGRPRIEDDIDREEQLRCHRLYRAGQRTADVIAGERAYSRTRKRANRKDVA